jgi:hypothetical protein
MEQGSDGSLLHLHLDAKKLGDMPQHVFDVEGLVEDALVARGRKIARLLLDVLLTEGRTEQDRDTRRLGCVREPFGNFQP